MIEYKSEERKKREGRKLFQSTNLFKPYYASKKRKTITGNTKMMFKEEYKTRIEATSIVDR